MSIYFVYFVCFLSLSFSSFSIDTIDDFNNLLIKKGIASKGSYLPTFYVRFAPRIENPDNIHFRLARGNQARVTAILNTEAVLKSLRI